MIAGTGSGLSPFSCPDLTRLIQADDQIGAGGDLELKVNTVLAPEIYMTD